MPFLYNALTGNLDLVNESVVPGAGIVSLNGLISGIQSFATGTSGTNFNIASTGSTHTFNLPVADATHTGKLSAADWTTFNSKLGPNQQLIAADGTVSAPGIRFTTDNDTGFFQTGDGNLSIAANGQLNAEFNQTEATFHKVLNTDTDVNVGGNLDVTGNITAANYPPVGSFNTFAGFDGSGNLESIPGFQIDTLSGGMTVSLTQQSNALSQNVFTHSLTTTVDPLQNSPDESTTVMNFSLNLDPNSSGFDLGTNGLGGQLLNLGINHQGTSNTGQLVMININSDIGNGTDPITIDALSLANGFSNIDNNVTIDGTVQGWGFQPNIAAGAIGTANFFGKAFYDNANFQIPVNGYYSIDLAPQIAAITNNHGFSSVNINPNITTLQGNANAQGVNVGGNIGTINSGGYNGVNVVPTIALNKGYVTGINVTMDSVTNYAGLKSSVIIQDITYEFVANGDNNAYQIEYLDDTTAGNESFTILGQLITCHMESGVSTATQIASAAALNIGLVTNINVTITGVGSNTQTAVAATNFTGGENPGYKKAAQFDGDVSIDGALSFTGALSIGQFTSYAPQTIVSGTGGVASIDSLITEMDVPASATLTQADTLGVNTASLINVGAGASVSTNFIGLSALGLPAVANIGAGASVDRVNGAAFALSLGGGTGTIDTVNLCEALAIPDGTTTINNLRGYHMGLPFGNVGTLIHGIYIEPAVNNYIAGNIKIGDGADTVANTSVALEIESTTKAMLLSRMTTTQRDAMTAIDGMMIYNNTDNKFQGYANGAWVDFH